MDWWAFRTTGFDGTEGERFLLPTYMKGPLLLWQDWGRPFCTKTPPADRRHRLMSGETGITTAWRSRTKTIRDEQQIDRS